MAATDQAMKHFVVQHIVEIVSWLLGCTIRAAEPLTDKLLSSMTTLAADQVFKVTLDDGQMIIVHLEYQGRRTKVPMPFREVEYLARIARTYPGIPIVSIVIYIGHGAGKHDTGVHTVPGYGGVTTLAWAYQVIRIWQMDANEVLDVAEAHPVLVPFVGLTHIRNVDDVARRVVDIVARIDDRQMRQSVLDLVMKLVERPEVYMRLVDMLEHDPMFANSPYKQHMRELAQRGKEEGRKEGRKEGREEGREEGKLLTLRMSIVEIVQLRFPNAPGIVARLEAYLATVTDEARLRALFAAAVQAESSATVSNLFNGSPN